MPLMQMPRKWTVTSLYGHTVFFSKDKPVHVPNDQRVIDQCLAAGAVYVEQAPALPDQDVPEVKGPVSANETKAKCFALFKTMTADTAAHRENFTAFGRPNAKYVSSQLGYEVSAKEVEGFWTEFRTETK